MNESITLATNEIPINEQPPAYFGRNLLFVKFPVNNSAGLAVHLTRRYQTDEAERNLAFDHFRFSIIEK